MESNQETPPKHSKQTKDPQKELETSIENPSSISGLSFDKCCDILDKCLNI